MYIVASNIHNNFGRLFAPGDRARLIHTEGGWALQHANGQIRWEESPEVFLSMIKSGALVAMQHEACVNG